MAALRLRPDTLHWRRIDDEVIAIDIRASTYLSANGSGALLWEALAEGATREELAELLVHAFDIDRARAITDVESFLDDLTGRGLLVDEAAP